MILAGDIGGTNTRLGFFESAAGHFKMLITKTYPSKEYDSLELVVDKFTAEQQLPPIDAACFAIAGPVHSGRVLTTNLSWVVDASRLAKQLRLPSVGLINDLEAIGYGIPALSKQEFSVLNEGTLEAAGNLAIIAAGTGLGQAGCYWDGSVHHPFACEGGHTDFAPRNAVEMELLQYLLGKFDRVSYERILSGSGLFEIYQFLHHTGRGEEPALLTEVLYQEAHPASIVRAALDGRSDRCSQALDLFVSLYGAEAGNLALKIMATGGVYLGGGIAPKIIERLTQPTFMEAFKAKGRMRRLLEAMPVRVILNDKTGLLGAARYAAILSAEHGPSK